MEFRYEHNAIQYTIRIEPQTDGSYRAVIDDRIYQVEIQRAQPGLLNLIVDGRHIHAYTARQKSPATRIHHHYIALLDREARVFELTTPSPASRSRTQAAAASSLTAQMPGQIMQVLVSPGTQVEKGQTLLTLEAMKMEIRVAAPYDGTVSRLLVTVGDTVERGQQLVDVTPSATP